MSTPVPPAEPSTTESSKNPNSITNILKKSIEQKKQAASDTVYDTKASAYEGFYGEQEQEQPPPQASVNEVAASFAIVLAILLPLYFLIGRKGRR